MYLCKSRIYDAVQETAQRVPGLKRDQVFAGVQHQICKAHVLRNTKALIDKYQPLVAKDADGSLAAIGVSPQQSAADLTRLGQLVKSRQKGQAA